MAAVTETLPSAGASANQKSDIVTVPSGAEDNWVNASDMNKVLSHTVTVERMIRLYAGIAAVAPSTAAINNKIFRFTDIDGTTGIGRASVDLSTDLNKVWSAGIEKIQEGGSLSGTLSNTGLWAVETGIVSAASGTFATGAFYGVSTDGTFPVTYASGSSIPPFARGMNATTAYFDIRGRLIADGSTIDFTEDGELRVIGVPDPLTVGTLIVTNATTLNNSGNDNDFIVKGQNNDNLIRADAATDKVGIGRASPQKQLHVAEDMQVDEDILVGQGAVINNSQGNFDFRVKSDTINDLLFADASANRVGIGTDAPTELLEVNGNSLHVGHVIQAVSPQFIELTTTEMTGDINNWNLTDSGFVRISSNADWKITGFVPLSTSGNAGEKVMFVNVGSSCVTFTHEDAASAADNRIITNADGTSIILLPNATITFQYDNVTGRWRVMAIQAADAQRTDHTWSFITPSSGEHFVGGFYQHASSDNDFNPSVNFGTANAASGAHFFVVAAAGGGGGTDTVIRITGTSMTDTGTRTTADTEDLTLVHNGSAGAYYETVKKWIGQIAIVVLSGPDLLCNYGLTKYWDDHNMDFMLLGLETKWIGGGNDATAEIELIHHRSTDWTYVSGANAAVPPTPIHSMSVTYGTERQIFNGVDGAWKLVDLSDQIDGAGIQGVFWRIKSGAAKTFAMLSLAIRIIRN